MICQFNCLCYIKAYTASPEHSDENEAPYFYRGSFCTSVSVILHLSTGYFLQLLLFLFSSSSAVHCQTLDESWEYGSTSAEVASSAEENTESEIVNHETERAQTDGPTEFVTDAATDAETEEARTTEEVSGATEEPEAIATASEGAPTTSESVTDEEMGTSTPEDANVPHTECSCHLTTGLLGLSAIPVNELANGPLTGFKRPLGKCDPQTFVDCREDCKLLVPTFTHDFDLTAAPFTRRDSDEKSLGARICSKVGTQPYFARVGLRAEVRCDVKATDSTPARPNYTSANLMSSKQRLSCVAGLPIVSPF